jgi:hypothetical protein
MDWLTGSAILLPFIVTLQIDYTWKTLMSENLFNCSFICLDNAPLPIYCWNKLATKAFPVSRLPGSDDGNRMILLSSRTR